MLPADRRPAPVGPEVSWPAGYSDQEYRDGDYRYQAPQAEQLPPASHGGHPYAAFTSAGYGDDGYRDPGYQGPAAQDAGIAGHQDGTRVRRDSGQGWGQPGYPAPDGYAGSSYQQGNAAGYPQGPGIRPGRLRRVELRAGRADRDGVPADRPVEPRNTTARTATGSRGITTSRSATTTARSPTSSRTGTRRTATTRASTTSAARTRSRTTTAAARPPGYDSDAYNGSDYSTPGIGGNGYDLAGIIGTSDFEAVGYDEPSYDRLAYDDPRYGEGHGYNSRSPFDETRFDVPGFDETRLDNLWLPGDDVRQEAAPVGYGNDGFTDAPVRSGYSDFGPGPQGDRFAETRFDMSVVDLNVDHTRFDVPAFDETRIDSLRRTSSDLLALGPRPAGQPCSRGPPPSRGAGSRTPRSTTSRTSTSPTSRCPPPSPGPSSGPRPRRTTPPPGARSAAAAVAAVTGGSGWRSAPSRSSPQARSAAC